MRKGLHRSGQHSSAHFGGVQLPLQSCCLSGAALDPPIGQWEWRCSLLPEDGFAIGSQPQARLQLNPSRALPASHPLSYPGCDGEVRDLEGYG